jgi:hypothetical protein
VFPVRYGLYLCVPYGTDNKPIVSLNSINRLDSVAETSCIFCEVRAALLCYLEESQSVSLTFRVSLSVTAVR